MIIAGPCLMVKGMEKECVETAKLLKEIGVDYFRCKIWGGGTTPKKWNPGIGNHGLATLMLCDAILPTMTEVQTPEQFESVLTCISAFWIGARNSANYGLLRHISSNFAPFAYNKIPVFIKRGPAMSVEETIGLYDIVTKVLKMDCCIIERGTAIIDREPDSKWGPDLKGVIRIKHDRPDIFESLVVDCSHSVFRREHVKDVYDAFKAIGVNNFMFEAIRNKKKAVTDTAHVLSVEELDRIIN